MREKKSDLDQIVQQIRGIAGVARGMACWALEQRLPALQDDFLRRAVGFIVDGVDAIVTRDATGNGDHAPFRGGHGGSQDVFESAGGYAPPSAFWVRCWG